ncbi:iron complex outermembrane receptor protein [Gelidibacter algens]|uniref:Iron complex outermembrane receptor protein n=1 Tax=Gelidibacter algens TaxID=49280 RepID=A0A1A7QX45_9FLAO|nr:TonB-dependent receptor [Gelidibacter algens]OBX23794.1 TonB-dependent receptor [Gelidibacter algens]RAJ27475.1 iron complex outermembrane receptor protein [Gelidibacter algens]
MKHIFSVLLLLAIPSIYAQNTLTGSVSDKNTNEPLIFANIYLPQLEKGATTDGQGNYAFNNIPKGTYSIIVSIIGYETLSQNISFPYANSLDFKLIPSAIEMEEIIISTPFHKLQSENVMMVERETIANLKAKGAVTLADGITSIPGVESVTTGVSIGKPVIRGLSSNRVLVYTQGVRLENQQFGDEHGLGLSDSGIESVEVIKGPASLLYGSDALGGVLYLNPEKFARANTNGADASYNYFSSTRGYNTNAGYKASGEHFKFLFRGSLAEHADYNTAEYRVTNSRFREQDLKAGLGYQLSNFKTELRYNVNNSKLGIPEELGVQNTNNTPLLPFQEVTNHVLSSKSTVFLNNSSFEINFGLLYNDRKEFEEHHDDHGDDDHDDEEYDDDPEAHEDEALEAALHMKLKTFNYDVKYNLPTLGKFETIVGVQGMTQSNANYGEEQLIPDAITNDFGFLATSHIHFENSDIQIGARYDHRNIDVISGLNKTFSSFNGAVGIKTNLAKNITSRLNLASGYRAPNLAELTSDGTHEGTNRYEIGNENLKNEQNFQADLALEFKNEHVEIFVNAFYNKVNNYIFISPSGALIDDTPVFNYLQSNANLYGGELGLHFHPHPLDWLHIESSFETVTGKQENDSYLPLIPSNSLSNTLRVEFNTKAIQKLYAFVRLNTNFKQSNVSDFETPTNGYNLLGAGFGGTVNLFKNNLDIRISGSNLTDKTYINHLSRLKSDGIFNMGRNINVGLTYTL